MVTLTWSKNSTTKVVVDITRDTRKIFHIGEKGIGGK